MVNHYTQNFIVQGQQILECTLKQLTSLYSYNKNRGNRIHCVYIDKEHNLYGVWVK